jgi:Trp operon repressor
MLEGFFRVSERDDLYRRIVVIQEMLGDEVVDDVIVNQHDQSVVIHGVVQW